MSLHQHPTHQWLYYDTYVERRAVSFDELTFRLLFEINSHFFFTLPMPMRCACDGPRSEQLNYNRTKVIFYCYDTDIGIDVLLSIYLLLFGFGCVHHRFEGTTSTAQLRMNDVTTIRCEARFGWRNNALEVKTHKFKTDGTVRYAWARHTHLSEIRFLSHEIQTPKHTHTHSKHANDIPNFNVEFVWNPLEMDTHNCRRFRYANRLMSCPMSLSIMSP